MYDSAHKRKEGRARKSETDNEMMDEEVNLVEVIEHREKS